MSNIAATPAFRSKQGRRALCFSKTNHSPARLAFFCFFVLALLGSGAISAQTAHFSGVITTLGSGFSFPQSVTVDGSGNVFVADTNNNAVKEILAAGGYTTVNTLGSGLRWRGGQQHPRHRNRP